MLGTWAFVKPGAEFPLDLLLVGSGGFASEVLAHQPNPALDEIEREPKSSGGRRRGSHAGIVAPRGCGAVVAVPDSRRDQPPCLRNLRGSPGPLRILWGDVGQYRNQLGGTDTELDFLSPRSLVFELERKARCGTCKLLQFQTGNSVMRNLERSRPAVDEFERVGADVHEPKVTQKPL